MIRRDWLTLWLLGLGIVPAAAQPRLSVAPEARVETVFRWESQRCMDMHVPDSPARALRTTAGGIALFAAHLINIPLLGPDFDRLVPVCAAASRGDEAADPAAFRDRFWVQALVPFSVRGHPRVLGLASHEYMGWRHPGRCAASFEGDGRRPAAFRCWHSSITSVIAEEGDWRFSQLAPPQGVIATSAAPYDPARKTRTGFFSVSNALIEDGHATVMVYTEGVPGQPRGNCLLRAPLADLPGGWLSSAGGEFTQPLGGPFRDAAGPARPCDVVGDAVFAGAPVRSVLRISSPEGSWWIAVFTRAAPRGHADEASDGVFMSASRDLRRWSRPERLWAMTPFRSQPEAGVYYEYPSLIDHASPSLVFDRTATTAGAPRIHLYLTRLNLQNRQRGLDRDLVRIPVTLGGG